MIYRNTILTFLSLITLACALWISLFNPKHNNFTTPTTTLSDAYMENVTATIMDKQGKVKMKIDTPRLLHYKENDLSKLYKPQVILYRNSTHPWFITAQKATALQGINQVDFINEVVIHHPADEGSPATLIRTKLLSVFPEEQIARSDQVVSMEQPNLRINATGMYADIGKGDIKLLSATRGEYVPN